MRKWMMVAGGGLVVASCGGGGSGGSDAVPVVSGPPVAVTPTPTPTPSPTPSPTPTPTPASSYPRFVELTGARTFQSACASLLMDGALPSPQPATPFGDGLTLDHTAPSGGWAIGGDGVALSFSANDAVAAPAGQRGYEQTVAGSVQRLTVTDPVAEGVALDFARSLLLRTDRAAGSTLYSCVFGVPSTPADRPTTSLSYGKTGVNGTAYVGDGNGGTRIYSLAASTATVDYDAATGAMVMRVRLIGNLQTSGGVSTATTELGNFTGNGAVDAARGAFSGQLDSGDRMSLFSSFGGWFFGGTETAATFEILATQPGGGDRMSVVGTVVATR